MRCNRPRSFHATSPEYAIKPNKDNKILWHIDEKYVTNDLEKFKIIAQFQKAFNAWQEYFNPIKFESTSNIAEAPIVLRFMSDGDPSLPSPFGESTLAYAYFPNKESLGIHSDIYFNDKYKWAELHSDDGINLWKVLVHELGHSTGIDHNNIPHDIMYPTYQPNDDVNITEDTQNAIRYLYGQYIDKATPVSPLVRDLRTIFPEARLLGELTELQLQSIGKLIGVDILIEDLKKDNIDKIAKGLNII